MTKNKLIHLGSRYYLNREGFSEPFVCKLFIKKHFPKISEENSIVFCVSDKKIKGWVPALLKTNSQGDIFYSLDLNIKRPRGILFSKFSTFLEDYFSDLVYSNSKKKKIIYVKAKKP